MYSCIPFYPSPMHLHIWMMTKIIYLMETHWHTKNGKPTSKEIVISHEHHTLSHGYKLICQILYAYVKEQWKDMAQTQIHGKNIFWPLGQRSNLLGLWMYGTHCLMVYIHPIDKYSMPMSKYKKHPCTKYGMPTSKYKKWPGHVKNL